MANKNKRTKARRVKETKEAQHKKVVEKPIYKRPWIWIALAALVAAIVIPSAYQGYQQLKEDRAVAEAEASEKAALEPLIWDSVLAPLADMGIEESAITDKTFNIAASTEGGEYDYAQVSVITDVRTVVATAYYSPPVEEESSDAAVEATVSEGAWTCMQITNEDGSHIYWTLLNQGVENATQAAVFGEDGSITTQPLYDYTTDEPVPEPTGAAIEPATETTGEAVDPAPETTGEAASEAPPETTGEAASEAAPETTGEAAG
ncbi:MAG: hypothetical protein LBL54_00500 [Clostridiales Family XIII bacterium]|jgi:hypothetical protein|nr:hypothetical protein [Clostridiales Family XIII bacterium]